MFDKILNYVTGQIKARGGIVNCLLMKDENGDINYKGVAMIYSCFGFLLYMGYGMIVETKDEIN